MFYKTYPIHDPIFDILQLPKYVQREKLYSLDEVLHKFHENLGTSFFMFTYLYHLSNKIIVSKLNFQCL